ncbi:flagellar biosynthesis regulator FlaF [Acetobacter estunensis NRIC 0472]|uniref:Flagellin assembly protein n=1 Tax=Acetobacter estunensis TaxID=104097 RepID=A0A967B691_9PROT|nr:flagellar biosynthesis regulator FlaF [Acetobacter estunensis]NHO53984.1 flagellin assembly protein [Acetobacter estunensis]GBQ20668.1 flagellar biosynthesis regulator FlaF [Acetobacter estunensis NRIC 0472]
MNYGIQRYNRSTAATMAPREVDIMAFGQAIALLKNAKDQESRLHALSMNQKLWSAVLREVAIDNNGMSDILRGDLTKLGVWATRYCIRAMLHDIGLKPLLGVNQDILDGLRAQQNAPAQTATAAPTNTSVLPADFKLVSA